MKICLFTDCFLPGVGGAEITAHNLARTFGELGHNVVVVTYNRKGLNRYTLPYTLETMRPLFYRIGLKTFIEKRTVCYFQNKYNFDIINIHKIYAGYAVGKMKDFLKVPVVITAHGGDIQKDTSIGYGMRFEKPAWEKKIKFAIQKADALVAISSESAQCFKHLGADETQIHRIANGVDIERFNHKIDLHRESLGLKKDDKIILAVGRYHIKKGYENLLNSMAIVKKEIPNSKLLMVGRQSQNLHNMTRELDLENNVIFVPEQKGNLSRNSLIFPNDFLLSLYQNSDIFVSSSIIEGFALVCIEAMAAGLPMVLTKAPGNEDVFGNDAPKGGYYVPVGDAQAMADKIIKLLNQPGIREEFSAFNRTYASQKYSLKGIASQYLDLFNKLIVSKRSENNISNETR